MGKGWADQNAMPGRIDFNVCRLDLKDARLLGDKQLLAEGAMGDVVLGGLLFVGQMQVQRDPERRRHKADSAEAQDRVGYTSIHVVRFRYRPCSNGDPWEAWA